MPSSFFLRSTAANVWKSVSGVSPAGRKRGRGRGVGRAIIKNFNIGQQIGVGRKMILAEGLNTRVSGYDGNLQVKEVDNNVEEFDKTLAEARKNMDVWRKHKDKPIDRGWSGRKSHGREAGSPDPYNETPFEGFHSTVLMLRPLLCMSGVFGRTRKVHALVVTGNGNGLAGFASGTGKDSRSLVRHMRNRAGQALVSVPLYDNHTVLHSFFSRYYQTTVFVERKPKGYGVKAHRIIRAICKAFGIKDLWAKVEGSQKNQINLAKAFFLGLMNQRSYQEMANEKQLHLVDLREETFNYPAVLASPKGRVRTDDEIKSTNENLDFTFYINNGLIRRVSPKYVPIYQVADWRDKHLDRQDYVKNREKTKILLAAKYGNKKVNDVFPYFITNANSFNKPR